MSSGELSARGGVTCMCYQRTAMAQIVRERGTRMQACNCAERATCARSAAAAAARAKRGFSRRPVTVEPRYSDQTACSKHASALKLFVMTRFDINY